MTDAEPSLASTVVESSEDVFSDTGGGSPGVPLETVKWSSKLPLLPARSWRTPARVYAPSASAPVAKVTWLPPTTGGTVPAPFSVTPVTLASASLATSSIELADATVAPSLGVEEARLGAVLSIRIPARTLARVLPKASEATARRS